MAAQGRLRLIWAGLGSWRGDDQDRFLDLALVQLRAGQRALADRVAAQTARDAALALGVPVTPLGLTDDEAVNLREGIEDREVYRRPFVATYTALSRGERFPEALDRGRVRLAEIVEMDMQTTYARARRSAMSRLPVPPKAWRRVVGDQDERGLCALAAEGRFSVDTLNPIRPGCRCEVVPVWDEAPHIPEQLTRAIRNHGEVGPMLVRPTDHFDGPRQVA